MRIATYQGAEDNQPKSRTVTWEKLCAGLLECPEAPCCSTQHAHTPECQPCKGKTCQHKLEGLAWSPVDIPDGLTRGNNSVRFITAAVLDLDHLTRARLVEVAQKVEGLSYVYHSTHNHAPERDDWCVRIIFPLTKPVPASMWRGFLKQLVEQLGIPADPSCKDLSRLYFFPLRPKHSAPFIGSTGEGAPIDTDQILAACSQAAATRRPAAPQTAGAPRPFSATELPPQDAGAVNVKELRSRLAKVSREDSKALMCIVLDGEPLGPHGAHPELRTPAFPEGYPGQDSTLLRVAGIMAHALPPGTPLEVMLELLRPSLRKTDNPNGAEHLEWVAAAKLERAIEDAASARAFEEEQRQRLLHGLDPMFGAPSPAPFQPEARGLLQPMPGAPPVGGGHLSAQPAAPGGASAGGGADPGVDSLLGTLTELTPGPAAAPAASTWTDLVQWKTDSFGVQTVPKNTARNARVILAEHPQWKGCIRFNRFALAMEFWGGPLCPAGRTHITVEEHHVTDTANWLAKEGMELNLSTRVVGEQLLSVAMEHVYDPIADRINATRWDGVPRLDTWLTTYLGAVTDKDGEDIAPYVRAIGRKSVISWVARGLRPGAQVDTVLILEGPQGVGKTTALRILGGEFYTKAQLAGDKDAKLAAGQFWVSELCELEAFSRSEVNALKSWFDTTHDDYRPPYGRKTGRVARRAVFIGTTNSEDYLKDPTGNRRYWPVRVGKVDTDRLRADVEQLLAEARERLAAGEPWWLTPEEQLLADAVVSDRMESAEDAWADRVRQRLAETPSIKHVTTTDMLVKWLDIPAERINSNVQRRAGQALRAVGLKRCKQRIAGRPTWVYLVPDELRAALGALEPVRVPQPPAPNIGDVLALLSGPKGSA